MHACIHARVLQIYVTHARGGAGDISECGLPCAFCQSEPSSGVGIVEMDSCEVGDVLGFIFVRRMHTSLVFILSCVLELEDGGGWWLALWQWAEGGRYTYLACD